VVRGAWSELASWGVLYYPLGVRVCVFTVFRFIVRTLYTRDYQSYVTETLHMSQSRRHHNKYIGRNKY